MTDEEKLYEAYKLAITARNFHYTNFNKWMTYFYIAIGAIFVAELNNKDVRFNHILPLLGFCFSILGCLSCKGYYFWIYNWHSQVTRFENLINEGKTGEENLKLRVYSVFSKGTKEKHNKITSLWDGANISTSKISLLFFFILSFGWGYLLIRPFIVPDCLCNLGQQAITIIISIAITFLVLKFGGRFLKSDINSHTLTKP